MTQNIEFTNDFSQIVKEGFERGFENWIEKNISKIDYKGNEEGIKFGKAGDLSRAIPSFDSVIRKNPDEVLAYFFLGIMYGKKGEYDKGIENFSVILQKEANQFESCIFIPELYYGNFKKSNGDTDWDAYNRAQEKRKSEITKEAKDLQKTLKSEAYYFRGLAYLGKGNSNEASANFKKAVEINQHNYNANKIKDQMDEVEENKLRAKKEKENAKEEAFLKKLKEEGAWNLAPSEFLQGFLKNLMDFNQSCKNIVNNAAQKLEANKEEKKKELSKVETQKEHIESAAQKKETELKKFEDELDKITAQEKLRLNDIYIKLTQAKLASDYSEIERLRPELFSKEEEIWQRRNDVWVGYQIECNKILQEQESAQCSKNEEISKKSSELSKDLTLFEEKAKIDEQEKINEQINGFKKLFDPEIIEKEYSKILAVEPIIENYECVKEGYTERVHIANLERRELKKLLNLGKHAETLLETYYPSLYKYDKLIIPYCVKFDESFNYLFTEEAQGKETLVNIAKSLVMRLFMTIKPDKVHFTFVDPIMLGDTFALFNQLVDANDRTSRVINEEVCITVQDIDKKLSDMTKYIANVSQNFLQGKYKNIKEYNQAAKQNAEPYQVLMIMDFPGSFKEESLQNLEKIISTGPKCGVYTVILESSEQRVKLTDEKLKLLISNIKEQTVPFYINENEVSLLAKDGEKIPISIINHLLSDEKTLKIVINKLRKGIKEADKTTILLDDEHMGVFPKENDWFKENSQRGLEIPIGIHGANNVQHLSFGTKAYHALIIGQIGSGKSSLLHTIIMNSLVRYPADELSIYLIDFKQGVEFKAYANHKLNAIRVVAIECEREFGSSVLTHLRKEFDDRSKLFTKHNVRRIEDYREIGEDHKKLRMPRILLIIDEFHILFSKDNDTAGKKAAENLEFLVREGRSHGFHIILASQSMANLGGGFGQEVWGQVGVRIALKCHPDDAKLVLGEDNDGVSLLSADKPGHAIYNSDCGNKSANQVFRVSYIERKDQEKKLEQMSAKEKSLDEILEEIPKLELGLLKTRVMVSNIEDNLYHPFKKFIDNGKSDAFEKADIFIGEPLQLSGKLHARFKDEEKSNMLVIGNDKQKAQAMFVFTSLSLSIHALARNDWKKPLNSCCVHIMNFTKSEDDENDFLEELKEKIPNYVEYKTFNAAIKILEELHKNLGKYSESQYLLIFGLGARYIGQNSQYQEQNHSNDGTGLEIGIKASLTPYQMLYNILQKGPENKIHTIMWADNFKTFQAHYQGWLNLFNLRVGFTMPNDDSVLFMEEPDGSQISVNNAVFSYNGNQKFRPYQMPDSDWVKKIFARINNF